MKDNNNHTVQDIETALGLKLPGAYISFLQQEQLTDSMPVTDLVLIYGLADLVERNQTYLVQQYLPEYLSIGDDSGGRGIFLYTSSSDNTVYTTGYGALDTESMEVLSEDFSSWVRNGYPLDIIREAPGVIAFRNTETFQLRAAWQALQRQLTALEKEKHALDLKTYLQQKRLLLKEIADFETLHRGKGYRV